MAFRPLDSRLPPRILDPWIGAPGQRKVHDIPLSHPRHLMQRGPGAERLLMLVAVQAGLVHDMVDRRLGDSWVHLTELRNAGAVHAFRTLKKLVV
jgi:hypothetical protein